MLGERDIPHLYSPHSPSLAEAVAKRRPGPVQTPAADSGGVPVGWPGVNSPRLRQQMGLGPKESEDRL